MSLRVFHCALTNSESFAVSEVLRYLGYGFSLTINTWGLGASICTELTNRFKAQPSVQCCTIDPRDSDAVLDELARGDLGYDVLVIPYPIMPFNETSWHRLLALQARLKRRLRVVATPNDSVSHLSTLKGLASQAGWALLHSDGIHADATAEYTFVQIGKHVRGLTELGNNMRFGVWQHEEIASVHYNLKGQSICVLGASGRDGSAICRLAQKLGMTVFTAPSRHKSANLALKAHGVIVCENMWDAVSSARLISVNVRINPDTRGVFDAKCFAALRPDTIIVSAAGCEVFDFEALVRELNKNPSERSLSHLVVDVPYGGADAMFIEDPRNQRLIQLGVEMTPRIAGYTIDSLAAANIQIADRIFEYSKCGSTSADSDAPGVQHIPISSKLVANLLDCIRSAGLLAESLRSSGLMCSYSSADGLTTNADDEVASYIRDRLLSLGYTYAFFGEELGPMAPGTKGLYWVVDGIDGTRNFRDGNYGWCVSVALLRNGETIVGAIYDPVFGISYIASAGSGAYSYSYEKNEFGRLQTPPEMPPDFSFSIGSFRVKGSQIRKQQIDDALKGLGGRGREWGSVALSICAAARGGLGVFIQGNSKLHDHVAGLLVAREAGACVREYPAIEAGRVDVVVSHPRLAHDVEQIFFDDSQP